MKIKVVADMTADLFHSGHVNLLKNARLHFGENNVHLTVALHTDEQILSYKSKRPVMDFECRKAVLLSCKYVDSVMTAPDDFDEHFINQFDFLVHGDDLLNWSEELKYRWYNVVIAQNKLITVPYTQGISTTELRKNVLQR